MRTTAGAKLFVLRDKDGKIWGPFEDSTKAIKGAEGKWPDTPRYEDCDGIGTFWDIEPIYPALPTD